MLQLEDVPGIAPGGLKGGKMASILVPVRSIEEVEWIWAIIGREPAVVDNSFLAVSPAEADAIASVFQYERISR